MQLQSGDRAFRSGSWAGEQPVADPDPWTGSIPVDDNAAVRINSLDRLREQGHGIGLRAVLLIAELDLTDLIDLVGKSVIPSRWRPDATACREGFGQSTGDPGHLDGGSVQRYSEDPRRHAQHPSKSQDAGAHLPTWHREHRRALARLAGCDRTGYANTHTNRNRDGGRPRSPPPCRGGPPNASSLQAMPEEYMQNEYPRSANGMLSLVRRSGGASKSGQVRCDVALALLHIARVSAAPALGPQAKPGWVGGTRRAVRDDNCEANERHAAFGDDLASVAVFRYVASDRGLTTRADVPFSRAVSRRLQKEALAFAMCPAFGQYPTIVGVEDQSKRAAALFPGGRVDEAVDSESGDGEQHEKDADRQRDSARRLNAQAQHLHSLLIGTVAVALEAEWAVVGGGSSCMRKASTRRQLGRLWPRRWGETWRRLLALTLGAVAPADPPDASNPVAARWAPAP